MNEDKKFFKQIIISLILSSVFIVGMFAFLKWTAPKTSNSPKIESETDCHKFKGDPQFKKSEEWKQDGKDVITYTYWGCFIRIKL